MECYWAKHHISIESEGTFRPCCTWRKFESDDPDMTGPYLQEPNVTTVEDYYKSDFYNQLNDILDKDIWPAGCEDCREHETIGNDSMRITSNQHKLEYSKYTDAEIKFGNLCNLGCVMCSPYNSSLLADEYKKYKSQHKLFKRSFTVTNKWYENEDNIKAIANSLADRTEIHFSGGEPTVNNYLIIFLQELVKNEHKPLLKIRTNANNWPTKLHNLLEQFPTKISVSIDAIEEANGYIRWPSKWNKIQKNVDKMLSLPDTQLKLNPTVAAYNVHMMPDLHKWSLSQGIELYNFDSVWGPAIFAANNSEEWQKEIFKEYVESIGVTTAKKTGMHNVLNHVLQQGKGLSEAIDFFKILDYNRGTDYKVLGI